MTNTLKKYPITAHPSQKRLKKSTTACILCTESFNKVIKNQITYDILGKIEYSHILKVTLKEVFNMISEVEYCIELNYYQMAMYLPHILFFFLCCCDRCRPASREESEQSSVTNQSSRSILNVPLDPSPAWLYAFLERGSPRV